ncbi:microtubule-actin cross-linking factor 1-like protein [Lates japonicus]|uniref:Microtubule-actin cross-linking factor 1-like protein n=1 Tax=Lates japonicus TaxID=270547 RepID=A0AAD3NNE3_LATJO|nr:microtubule-actin cross-linking factor 1-like protein [Lates japonicus]
MIECRSTVASLVGRAKTVVQLHAAQKHSGSHHAHQSHLRLQTNRDHNKPGRSACWKDNSQRPKWKVVSPTGGRAMVPRQCVHRPPPNQEAIIVTEQLYQKVSLASAPCEHEGVVSCFLLKDIRTVSGWNLDRRELSVHQPEGKRPGKEGSASAQQYCQDLLRNMESVCRRRQEAVSAPAGSTRRSLSWSSTRKSQSDDRDRKPDLEALGSALQRAQRRSLCSDQVDRRGGGETGKHTQPGRSDRDYELQLMTYRAWQVDTQVTCQEEDALLLWRHHSGGHQRTARNRRMKWLKPPGAHTGLPAIKTGQQSCPQRRRAQVEAQLGELDPPTARCVTAPTQQLQQLGNNLLRGGKKRTRNCHRWSGDLGTGETFRCSKRPRGLIDQDCMSSWAQLIMVGSSSLFPLTLIAGTRCEKADLWGKEAAQAGLVGPNTAARLLEAQVASGIIDLRRDKKVSVTLAANLGLVVKTKEKNWWH